MCAYVQKLKATRGSMDREAVTLINTLEEKAEFSLVKRPSLTATAPVELELGVGPDVEVWCTLPVLYRCCLSPLNSYAQTGEDYAYMSGETSERAELTSEVEVAVEAGQEEGLEETLSNMGASSATVEDEGTAVCVSSYCIGSR